METSHYLYACVCVCLFVALLHSVTFNFDNGSDERDIGDGDDDGNSTRASQSWSRKETAAKDDAKILEISQTK